MLDHFGEVVPGADAFIAEMVDPGIGIMRCRIRSGMTVIVIQYHSNCLCQIQSICRGAHLVEDDLELGLGGGEVQHCLTEVLAEFGVEPGGADYHIIAACGDYLLFSVEFGQPINSGGGCRSGLRGKGCCTVPCQRRSRWRCAPEIHRPPSSQPRGSREPWR